MPVEQGRAAKSRTYACAVQLCNCLRCRFIAHKRSAGGLQPVQKEGSQEMGPEGCFLFVASRCCLQGVYNLASVCTIRKGSAPCVAMRHC
jgi:hypothetical protein